MWGPDPSAGLRLTLEDLGHFKAEIPETSLPTKYLEAIRITKALGFQYIWIDSLCIIQDSAEDWNKEARKMSAVYGRSSCNISYVHPPSDAATKQHLRDPRRSLPCRILPSSWSSETSIRPSLIIQRTEHPLRRHWSANVFKGDWPLLSRAWVFQERLRCPRNIYYGSEILYWECCEGVEDEFYGPVVLSEGSKAEFYSVFSVDDQSEYHQVRTLIRQWFSLVQAYRLGSLTYESDRIMAFAGVARAIQLQTNYLYLAGIWREFAELGLLWHIESPWSRTKSHFRDFPLRRQNMQIASPSWSWFSVPTIPEADTPQIDVLGFRICSSLCIRSSFAIYRARIVSFHHPTFAADPDSLLYDFKGMSITLRAPKIPCTMLWDEEVLRVLPRGCYVSGDAGWQDPREALDYCRDDFNLIPGSATPTEACMALTIICASTIQDGEKTKYDKATSKRMGLCPEWQYAGLVVVPSAQKGYWRRVGVFVFTTMPRDGIHEVETPFNLEDDQEDIVMV
ncbi:hypothetical protein FDECE_812 [Fusarium decemcellulare]|nr:hypothetical protein FDECE_812 [Fusarium decemcellulare]